MGLLRQLVFLLHHAQPARHRGPARKKSKVERSEIGIVFITLSTIGFGDYVPGTSLHADSQGKMVLCALYLIVGLALLAMCFDLMQEEVRRKFRTLGIKIGLFERPYVSQFDHTT